MLGLSGQGLLSGWRLQFVDAADSVLGYNLLASFIRRLFGELRGGWIILIDLSVTMIYSSTGPGSRTGSLAKRADIIGGSFRHIL